MMTEEGQEIKEGMRLILEALRIPNDMDSLIATEEWGRFIGLATGTFIQIIDSVEMFNGDEEKISLLRLTQMSFGLGFALGANADAWQRVKDYISIPNIPDVFKEINDG